MLNSDDFIHLAYTPDLTEGGIAYACRSLAYTYNRMGGSPFDRLRRIVGGVAVELAFRRYLLEQNVPFDVLGATPFTDPDHYDVSLGGHRCDLKSFLINRRPQISLARREPATLLQAAALLPLDQFAAEGHTSQDIYLFAFLLALTTAAQEDLKKAIAAGQAVHLIHALPEGWSRPRQWQPLEKLTFKSECDQPLAIEIGGMDSQRNFISAALDLPPRTRIPAPTGFYTLAYVHARRLPEARLGLHSPARGEAFIIQPHGWGNIWVYGMDILLTGYLTHEEFRRRASLVPAGSRVFQYSCTRTRNLAVPIADLRPPSQLFERVKEWAANRG